MQESILKGIVLRAIDWSEKDKILTVFTLEQGKVSIALKGVRQQKSKLKFASQPLCFAEFSVVGSGDILRCTNAMELGSFFDITNDYDRIVYASAMLEMVDSTTVVDESNAALFLCLAKSLQALCDNNIAGNAVLAKFVLFLLYNAGYGLNLVHCKVCGAKYDGGASLDLNAGQLNCLLCGDSDNKLLLSPQVLQSLSLLDRLDIDELGKYKVPSGVVEEILHILITDFSYRFNKRLKSIKF